jgi:hypothetical protein
MSRYYLNGGDAFRLKLWIDKRPSNVVIEDEIELVDEDFQHT